MLELHIVNESLLYTDFHGLPTDKLTSSRHRETEPLSGSDGDALYVSPRRELRSVLMRNNRDGRGTLALPRMNAHRMVVAAAALTILGTAMLASPLAVLIGQPLPLAPHKDLPAAGTATSITISGSVNAANYAEYNSTLPGQLRSALDNTPFTLYHSEWSDPLGFAPGTAPASGANVAILNATSYPDLTAHASLLSGSWPAAPAAGQANA